MTTMTPTKDKNYYMNQRYKLLLWLDDDGFWNIEIPALQGCRSDGETVAEALEMIEDAKEGWIEVMLKHNEPIPDSDIPHDDE
jgi:antitoxin HicB